ncbi:MAG TPA: aldo/keto reductase [Phenylobacterium sp.]|nr:aldo/keto reductase [Phenylobacterium sp.]
MELRYVGDSGLRVSKVGLGCNNFADRSDFDASRRVIDAAIDHGITFFDTADVYGRRGGSEDYLGQILGAERRQRVVLGTKFSIPMDDEGRLSGGSRAYVMQAVEASLRRLRTDWIDLYQLHMPDPRTPIEETLRAMEDLIRQGKVRYIGCSNLSAWQLVEAHWTAKSLGLSRFISASNEYSLVKRGVENDILPVARKYGVGFLPYFPLASGLLSGKYRRDTAPPQGSRFETTPRLAKPYADAYETVERLATFAEARGRSLLELAFSWLLSTPTVPSVIAGATSAEQVEQNVRAADWVLSADELAEIDRLTAQP